MKRETKSEEGRRKFKTSSCKQNLKILWLQFINLSGYGLVFGLVAWFGNEYLGNLDLKLKLLVKNTKMRKWSPTWNFLSTLHKNPIFCSFANSNQIKRSVTTENSPKITSKSINEDDVRRFGEIANTWWDPSGPIGPLHSLNSIRVPFIRDGLVATNKVKPELVKTAKSLEGLKLLEVGCGGGVLTENLARIHAHVTAIDVGTEVINVAKRHLEDCSPELIDNIVYKRESVDQHAKENPSTYDAVVVSEVIEHVLDKVGFLNACVATLKPQGSLFITTFNKTFFSWLGGIIFAEKILKIVPDGTHDWDNFISVTELQRILESLNCSTVLVNGFTMNALTNTWHWIPTLELSIALHAIKRDEA